MIAPPGARRLRPDMPHYGVMPDAVDGMLSWDWVAERMSAARNYWICTARADGRPHAAPVWGAWYNGTFYFGTDSASVKAANIRRDPRVALHLDSGEEVVIMEGALTLADLPAQDLSALDAIYTQKYGMSPELETEGDLVLQLHPRKVMAWREKDFPSSATAWRFE